MKYLLEVFTETKTKDFKNFIDMIFTLKLDKIIDEKNLKESTLYVKLKNLTKDTNKIILKYFEIEESIVNRKRILDDSIYSFKVMKKTNKNPLKVIEFNENLELIDSSKDIFIDGISFYYNELGWNRNDFTNQIISDIVCDENINEILKYFPEIENLEEILKTNNILVTNTVESSGSHYYSYNNTIKKEDGNYYINVDVNIPSIGTDDLKNNVLFFVIPKEIRLIDIQINLIENYE